MGADSFGARVDPTTDQLKWKKVQMSYFNELHRVESTQDWRLEGVSYGFWVIFWTYTVSVAELGTDFDIDPRCGFIWDEIGVLEFRGWALDIMHLTNSPPEFHFYNLECIN